jgi:hypothetical protein
MANEKPACRNGLPVFEVGESPSIITIEDVKDVNTLIAPTGPNHVHHQQAHRWFDAHSKPGRTTCPVTQSAFVFPPI